MEVDVCVFLHFLLFITRISCLKDLKLITIPANIDDNFYFEIVEPSSISYNYKIRPAKDFGIPFNTTYIGIKLIPVEPFHGCSSIENAAAFYRGDSIAFIQRGECSFVSKTLNAESIGARAVVIADYDKDNIQSMVDMIQDETDREVHIPAFFMQGKDGAKIMETLQSFLLPSAIINIPVNVTGRPLSQMNLPPWNLW